MMVNPFVTRTPNCRVKIFAYFYYHLVENLRDFAKKES